MDTRDEALGLFTDGLGIGSEQLSCFEGRKAFQKAIYLLQEEPFSWDMGFRYNLYIRGPYSPQLAEAGYRLLDNPREWEAVRDSQELVGRGQRDVRTLRRKFADDSGELDGDLLELAATYHFLRHRTFRYVDDPSKKHKKSRAWIREHKPDLVARLTEAVRKLRRLEMID
ncbi:MAG: hypothetical protein IMF16_00240 [Proteobacteria bacterium]|nr:hypothetical protein [Pseudomonadota bacterium]